MCRPESAFERPENCAERISRLLFFSSERKRKKNYLWDGQKPTGYFVNDTAVFTMKNVLILKSISAGKGGSRKRAKTRNAIYDRIEEIFLMIYVF
jgi:hypothetical protein